MRTASEAVFFPMQIDFRGGELWKDVLQRIVEEIHTCIQSCLEGHSAWS